MCKSLSFTVRQNIKPDQLSWASPASAASCDSTLGSMKAALLALTLVFGVAHAAEPIPPPAWPVPDIKPSPLPHQPVTGITIGRFAIKLEQTTFKDVTSHLGSAPIGQRGDAGEFQMWVCYSLPEAHARVWLTSSELGGREYIDGFVARREPRNVVAEAECPAIIGVSSIVVADRGIGLGSSENSIIATLGKPSVAPNSVIYYAYLGKDGEYDVSSVLALKINKGEVIEIHATHSTTN